MPISGFRWNNGLKPQAFPARYRRGETCTVICAVGHKRTVSTLFLVATYVLFFSSVIKLSGAVPDCPFSEFSR